MTQPDMSWSAQLARLHAIEWAPDWQYATVWRFADVPTEQEQEAARKGGPPSLFEPPAGPQAEGSGWELNMDRNGGRAFEVRVPVWSDGAVVIQRVYWRRPRRGLVPYDGGAHLHEQRR